MTPSGLMTTSLGIACLLAFGSTGCATKKHVRQVVAPIEARVSAVEQVNEQQKAALAELQGGVSRADERATEADRRAMEADRKAQQAGLAAQNAQASADRAGEKADQARVLAERGMARLGEVVENLDNYRLVGTGQVHFSLNSARLSEEAKQQLDQVAAKLAGSKNYIIEVQGFTDTTGPVQRNLELSRKRADAVVRYLTVHHQIPLRKIHVLGVGEEQPVADNKSREGRKQNRRVELKVFSLDIGGPERSGTQALTGASQGEAYKPE